MKVTLYSFLVKLLPEQVDIESRKTEENSQNLFSPQTTKVPATSDSELSGCVQNNTNQPRKTRRFLTYLIEKMCTFLKRPFPPLPFKQHPNQATMDNAKVASQVSSFNQSNERFNNGDVDAFINATLDDITAKLVLSQNIDDIAEAFKRIDERMGKAEFVIAIMTAVILENKLWKRCGYSSMSRFLNDLSGICKVTRQTFYNAAQAGQIIRCLSCYNPKAIVHDLDFSLAPAFFYKNYAKVKFLYRIFYVWNQPLTNEILLNFRDMTFREFENFMKVYEERNKAAIDKEAKLRGKRLQQKSKVQNPKPSNIEIPKLIGQDIEIYREVRLGHIVGYVFSNDPVCIESIKKFLNETSKREDEKLNKNYFNASELFDISENNKSFAEGDWAELDPNNSYLSVGFLENALLKLSPQAIKNAFEEKFKTKSELTLAQAYLLLRISEEQKLRDALNCYLKQHEIKFQSDPVKDFFIIVLGIGDSQYKWLKRISEGLSLLGIFKEDAICFTSEGFLEKLSYLPTARKNHPLDLKLTAYALNTLSVKRFRDFARNKDDNLSQDPIALKDYLKAKPFIDKLHSYQSEGKSVTIIGLKSELEQNWLERINQAMENGSEYQRKRYPGIVWDSTFQVENAIETSLETGGNEQELLNQDEKVIEVDLQQDVSNNSIVFAA